MPAVPVRAKAILYVIYSLGWMLESWAAYGLYSPHYMYVICSLVIFALSFPQLIAGSQIYLYVVIASYGNSQRRDHDRYNQVYDPTQPITENVPLNNQNDPWDSRPSGDYLSGRKNSSYKHVRQESSMSASDVYNQPYQEPKDSFSTASLNYDHANQYSQNAQNPVYPSYAHTQSALPTPTNNYYDAPVDSHIERPLQAQPHPGELIFY